MKHAWALVAWLMYVADPNGLSAQATTRISSAAVCNTCRLQFDHLFDIGTESGAGMIENENSMVVRDSRGRFYVAHSYATSFKVFDKNGKFVRLIGRKGGGPGEFEGIVGIHISIGDSVRVLDYSLSRQSVYSPDLSFYRSTPLALKPSINSVVLDNGSTVVNVRLRSASLSGSLLHTLSTSGIISSSFGEVQQSTPQLTQRLLAVRSSSEIWVAHEHSYQFERWEPYNGKLIARYEYNPPWFSNKQLSPTRRWNGATDPPQSQLTNIRESSDGSLWVHTAVSDRRWKSVVSIPQPGHISVSDFDQYHDYVIEVIDWKRGILMMSFRFDKHPGYPIADGMFAGLVTERDGRVVIPIYKVTIIGDHRK